MRYLKTILILVAVPALSGCDAISSYLPGGTRLVEQRCTTANCTATCGAREIIIAAVCAGPANGPTTAVTVRRNAQNQPDAPWTATCLAPNQTLILTCSRR